MSKIKSYNFVLPSLKISGGIKETLKLANEVKVLGREVNFFIMWVSPNEISDEVPRVNYLSKFKTNARFVFFQFPFIFFKLAFLFAVRINRARDQIWIFTHYTTFPLSLMVPRNKRVFFVQGMEWNFVKNKIISALLRRFILYFYKGSIVVTANRYLSLGMEARKIKVYTELPIWADIQFLTDAFENRYIDFVMVLRKGGAKRIDLYLEFIHKSKEQGKQWTFAVITPDNELAKIVSPIVEECYIKPSILEMSDVYSRSKFFLMMSDHEGFGLPPLEAMGAGCVPICRDAGGIHAYMLGGLKELVLPLELDISGIISFANDLLIKNEWFRYSSMAKKVFMDGVDQSRNRAQDLMKLI